MRKEVIMMVLAFKFNIPFLYVCLCYVFILYVSNEIAIAKATEHSNSLQYFHISTMISNHMTRSIHMIDSKARNS